MMKAKQKIDFYAASCLGFTLAGFASQFLGAIFVNAPLLWINLKQGVLLGIRGQKSRTNILMPGKRPFSFTGIFM